MALDASGRDKLAEFLIKDFEKLQSNRNLWESHWQEVAELVQPDRDFTIGLARGAKRHNRLFDSIGLWANDRFASGLSSFLTSPTLMWFFLKVQDPRAMDDPDVKAWLFAVRDLMMSLFVSPTANFFPNAHEYYLELGAFGTSAMFTGEIDNDIAFITRPLPEVYIRENNLGRVDTVMRSFMMTARQAKQEYGEENLPKVILDSIEKDPDKYFHFIHVVRPNTDFNPRTKITNKPFQSTHVLVEKKVVVRAGGFDEFPFLVARWTKVAGEIYGRSPGMMALPDLKMIQSMSKTILKAAQKATDPPIAIPDDGFLGPFRTAPGSFNYYRAGTMAGEDLKVLEHRGRIDIGADMLQQRRDMVSRAFFVDQLQNLILRDAKSPLTATEVLQRREETLRTMAPMVARMQMEFLGPLIERTFALMARAGRLPPAPESIQGQEVKVEFVSPAFIAQKSSDIENIQRWLELLMPVAQLDPQTIQLIVDSDEYVRTTADLLNIRPELVKSPEVVEQARQAMAQQAAQERQIEMMHRAGEAEGQLGEGAAAISQGAQA